MTYADSCVPLWNPDDREPARIQCPFPPFFLVEVTRSKQCVNRVDTWYRLPSPSNDAIIIIEGLWIIIFVLFHLRFLYFASFAMPSRGEREKRRYPPRGRKRKRRGKKEEEGEELSFFSPYVSVTWVSVKWILRDGRDWTLEASPPSKGDNVCTNPFLPRARNAVNNRSSCEISYLTVLFSNGEREGFEQIAINEWPGRNLWRIPMRRLDK